MTRQVKRGYIDYGTYIKSSAWYAKHPVWLKATGNRCTMFPWVKIGYGRGRYAIHHLHYRNLGVATCKQKPSKLQTRQF